MYNQSSVIGKYNFLNTSKYKIPKIENYKQNSNYTAVSSPNVVLLTLRRLQILPSLNAELTKEQSDIIEDVKENWFVRNMPFVNTIRRHHAAHHNLGIMMHKNMNLTFPVADWFLGTSDIKRSLLGTLFNGFDETYIDPKLKPIINKFKEGQVQEEKVTLEGPILSADEQQILRA